MLALLEAVEGLRVGADVGLRGVAREDVAGGARLLERLVRVAVEPALVRRARHVRDPLERDAGSLGDFQRIRDERHQRRQVDPPAVGGGLREVAGAVPRAHLEGVHAARKSENCCGETQELQPLLSILHWKVTGVTRLSAPVNSKTASSSGVTSGGVAVIPTVGAISSGPSSTTHS